MRALTAEEKELERTRELIGRMEGQAKLRRII